MGWGSCGNYGAPMPLRTVALLVVVALVVIFAVLELGEPEQLIEIQMFAVVD